MLCGRSAVGELPGDHALADMYAAVVHDAALDHFAAVRFPVSQPRSIQEIVPQVAQVQGLLVLGRSTPPYFLPVHGLLAIADIVVILFGVSQASRHRQQRG